MRRNHSGKVAGCKFPRLNDQGYARIDASLCKRPLKRLSDTSLPELALHLKLIHPISPPARQPPALQDAAALTRTWPNYINEYVVICSLVPNTGRQYSLKRPNKVGGNCFGPGISRLLSPFCQDFAPAFLPAFRG